ncbi:MAG TPA: hypothetical protein VGY53_05870, partial [Isosphaeraceae bacterium]|nr:hypothetical protein [Isosphaeraceae bacterium]
IRLAFVAVVAAGLAGCQARSGEAEQARHIPTLENAKAAVTATLSAWKEGRRGASISAKGPKVEVVDSYRKPDRPLMSFIILGPIEVERARCFAVRLSFANPEEEQVVRYVVFGEDPIWVFRQEDAERLSHWEHKMEEVEPGKTPPVADAPPASSGD